MLEKKTYQFLREASLYLALNASRNFSSGAATVAYPWVLISSLTRISSGLPKPTQSSTSLWQSFTVCEDWAGYGASMGYAGDDGGWGDLVPTSYIPSPFCA